MFVMFYMFCMLTVSSVDSILLFVDSTISTIFTFRILIDFWQIFNRWSHVAHLFRYLVIYMTSGSYNFDQTLYSASNICERKNTVLKSQIYCKCNNRVSHKLFFCFSCITILYNRLVFIITFAIRVSLFLLIIVGFFILIHGFSLIRG